MSQSYGLVNPTGLLDKHLVLWLKSHVTFLAYNLSVAFNVLQLTLVLIGWQLLTTTYTGLVCVLVTLKPWCDQGYARLVSTANSPKSQELREKASTLASKLATAAWHKIGVLIILAAKRAYHCFILHMRMHLHLQRFGIAALLWFRTPSGQKALSLLRWLFVSIGKPVAFVIACYVWRVVSAILIRVIASTSSNTKAAVILLADQLRTKLFELFLYGVMTFAPSLAQKLCSPATLKLLLVTFCNGCIAVVIFCFRYNIAVSLFKNTTLDLIVPYLLSKLGLLMVYIASMGSSYLLEQMFALVPLLVRTVIPLMLLRPKVSKPEVEDKCDYE